MPHDRRAAAEIPWSERREKVKVSLGYFFGIDNIRNIMKPCMQVGIEVENVNKKLRKFYIFYLPHEKDRRHSIHGSIFPLFRPVPHDRRAAAEIPWSERREKV